MDRQEALPYYIEAVMREREKQLHRQALNGARPLLRRMTAEEKEAYLQSQAFSSALYQAQRRTGHR